MKKFKLAVLPLFISSLLGFSCPTLAAIDKNEVMQSKMITFDGPVIPDNIDIDSRSKISLDNSHYIIGNQSLKWDWKSGSSLFVRQPIKLITDTEARAAWGRASTQVLSFWIYNETPIDDYVVIDLGRGLAGSADGDSGFKIKMNFKGWRSMGVSLANDIEGRMVEGVGFTDNAQGEGGGFSTIKGGSRSDMDTIRFTAPSAKAGTFWIDRIMLSIDDARYQWSDDHVKTRYDIPELDFRLPDILPKATAIEVEAAKTIFDSLINVFTTGKSYKGVKLFTINDIRKNFTDMRISRNEDGIISGRHIITGKQIIIYQPEFLTAEDKILLDDYVDLADYSNLLFNIGRMWNITTDASVKTELATMYITLTDHLIDQGFVDGSSLVTTHHWGYSSRWWYISSLLMIETLTKSEQRDTIYKSLLWYSREFKDNFEMSKGPDASNLDYFNTLALQHLSLLMLEPNDDKRIALLKKFGEYIDFAFSHIPSGGNDGFRPDGTAWRHEGNYPGYSFPAFNHAGQLAYMLNGTPFEIGVKGRKALKKVIMSAWVYSNPEVSLGLSGRHPFNPPSIYDFIDAMRWLAQIGDPKTGDKVDKELASVYLQTMDLSADESVAIFGERIEPAMLPQGYWAFNGGAFGIHRYGDNMVTMKAYNSNVWSSEIYYRDNRYGRYQSHGGVQVIPYGNQAAMGYTENGWDWNRNIGTTTIHLPLDLLDSPNTHTLMLRGTQPYSGASSLEGKYGMFAFKYKAPSMNRFVGDFVARKSTFSVDDRIVMLGSDISNSSEYPTETTLFQQGITNKSQPIIINGDGVNSFPYSAKLGKGDWLIDSHGTGYLITSDVLVEILRQSQASKHNKTHAETKGDYSVAYINHGISPKNVGYEYLLMLDATPEKMQKLSRDYIDRGKTPYIVIKKDNNVHIVKDEQTGVTAYAAFDSVVLDDTLVSNIINPSIIMTRKLQNGDLVISGVTPDLNMTRYTEAKPIKISAEINGNWSAVVPNEKVFVSSSGNKTKLTFDIYFGIPQELTLTPNVKKS